MKLTKGSVIFPIHTSCGSKYAELQNVVSHKQRDVRNLQSSIDGLNIDHVRIVDNLKQVNAALHADEDQKKQLETQLEGLEEKRRATTEQIARDHQKAEESIEQRFTDAAAAIEERNKM